MSEKPIALVTGGNRGIGLAIAHSLNQAGFRTVVASRTGQGSSDFDHLVMDVASTQSVDSAFAECEEKIGVPEVIVCNAGITRDGLAMRMSEEDFEEVMNTNLAGAFRVSKRATKGLLKLKRGRLIFVGSVVATLGSAGQVNYAASKSGLIGMARSYARELGSRGITANVVAPGFVETDMTEILDEKRKKEIVDSVPLGRFCSPQEVAEVVAFLATPGAAYISGAVIPVDGGLGMGH